MKKKLKPKKPKTLKEALKGKLTPEEIENSVRSFDVIGSIAVIEIPRELEKKEKLIAKTLLDMHKNITTVVKKVGGHEGIYRTQKVKVIAGKRTKVAVYKENGVTLKLNVETSYFSPRSSTERLRIAQQVKENEGILVMFSGIAPFPLVIAKNSKPKIVYGVEINPEAHKFALENVKLNKKTDKIKLFNGDVKEIVPKLGKKFDRIAMPLPKTGEDFLDVALSAVKKGGIIHFYDFQHIDEFDTAKDKVRKACKKAGKKYRILRLAKCGQQSPRVYRITVDFKVL